jgi:PAS domain-containing protein
MTDRGADPFTGLVARLYAAALEPASWPAALEDVAKALGRLDAHGAPCAAVRQRDSNAIRLQTEIRDFGRQSAVGQRALDQLAAGVIVTDGDGQIIEMNRAAERIVRRADGLKAERRKLEAVGSADADKLASFIAAAAAPEASATSIGRMLVGSPSSWWRTRTSTWLPSGTWRASSACRWRRAALRRPF